MGYLELVGFHWTMPLKWMNCGTPYLRKPPDVAISFQVSGEPGKVLALGFAEKTGRLTLRAAGH